MNNPDPKSSNIAQSWESYWSGTGDIGAYSIGGVSHPAILSFWDDFFLTARGSYETSKIIDIASGNGAVPERAMAVYGDAPPDFTCLDVSESAIANISSRFPEITGMVADARNIPLATAGFDIVTSQFGVEYAGLPAVIEASRLVSEGGCCAFLLHSQSGNIYEECAASLDAIQRLHESKFIPLASQLFRAGFDAVAGADRGPYDEAASKLAPAVAIADAIMADHGEQVAGNTISKLYTDVDRIHRSMPTHDLDEVLKWLETMEGELVAYAGRMSSMCASAVGDDDFKSLCTVLEQDGFSILKAEALRSDDLELPLAWVLIAGKGETRFRPESESTQSPPSESSNPDDIQAWVKKTLHNGVDQLIKKGDIFDGLLVEAKPAWALPFHVLIARVRERGAVHKFDWMICGETKTDHVVNSAAETPRDAARYFALRWQQEADYIAGLSAEQFAALPPDVRKTNGKELTKQAEKLYSMVQDDDLWEQQPDV